MERDGSGLIQYRFIDVNFCYVFYDLIVLNAKRYYQKFSFYIYKIGRFIYILTKYAYFLKAVKNY